MLGAEKRYVLARYMTTFSRERDYCPEYWSCISDVGCWLHNWLMKKHFQETKTAFPLQSSYCIPSIITTFSIHSSYPWKSLSPDLLPDVGSYLSSTNWTTVTASMFEIKCYLLWSAVPFLPVCVLALPGDASSRLQVLITPSCCLRPIESFRGNNGIMVSAATANETLSDGIQHKHTPRSLQRK